MSEILLKERVTLTKDESIHPDYGYLVEVDDDEKGTIVGINIECELLFEPCMPLSRYELLAIGDKLDEKQGEIFPNTLPTRPTVSLELQDDWKQITKLIMRVLEIRKDRSTARFVLELECKNIGLSNQDPAVEQLYKDIYRGVW